MASDEESLKALEALMNEFFDARTTNERKRQIEEILNNFSNQQGSWKHCLFFLSDTRNEYVMMYCLTVLENVINKQWIGMLGEAKGVIRGMLYKFLLSHHTDVPPFIRNKIGKLVIDMGRLDWPHFYPEFFTNILQLAQSSDTASLGMMLLQTASEELGSPRDDLSISRKEELHRLLLDQVPAVLNIISGHLESILEKHRHLVTATPPPSPTHGQATNSHNSLFNSSPLHSGCLLSSMFKSLSGKNPFQSLPPLDAESQQLCVQALNCLAHFFSWIPLSKHITSSLLTTVFHFASFGCDPAPSLEAVNSDMGMNPAPLTTNKATLGILAMGCINEIMSKNCVPTDFEDFLLQMFQNTFHLLQQLTKECTTNTGTGITSKNQLAELDENYIEKFTDFLRLFVSVHLRRFESNSQFPVLEFLALLFKYTFQQPTHDGFYSCLDIWGIFLEFLTAQLNRQADHSAVLDRYKEALASLVSHVLRKCQFKYNQSSLEELDDESLDDDSETEWQHFLRQCLEIIAKVADIMPTETYNILYPIFQENLDIYIGLEPYTRLNESGEYHLQVTAENECRRLHCSLRDMSSVLQGIGRLANHFIGEKFWKQKVVAQLTLERLCQAATYSNKMRLYDVKTAAPSVLRTDFIEVHAQTLATIKAFCHWLAQLHGESIQKNHEKDYFTSFVTTIMDSTVPVIIQKVPEKVTHSGGHLLMSLTYTVRPAFLYRLTSTQNLFAAVCQRQSQLYSLSLDTQQVIYRAVANILLLPWPSVADSDQDWHTRSSNFKTFTQSITAPLKQIQETTTFCENKQMQDQGRPAIKWTIQVLQDLIINLKDASTRTKQVCYQNLQEIIQVVIGLFPIYLHHPDVSEDILQLFLALFVVLRTQMGLPFVEQTIQTFLTLFTRNQLTESILNEGSAGCRVVEKFLELLQQIVQEPGSAYKALLPNTINLCMNQIYPIVAERPSPEVKQTLFELLYQILLHNWRYFFKTNVVATLGQAGSETVENAEHFTKIMQAYGQSFLQPDISLFRQNLEALENLNSKWKLYHKGLFRTLMLNQFLNVLLQTLVHKSHNLLQEEIGITIYNMASVDFENFYSSFLPYFLESCQGLDSSQKRILAQNFKLEMDLPSFTQSIHRFVNDLRYYRLCNSSLPAGSVHF